MQFTKKTTIHYQQFIFIDCCYDSMPFTHLKKIDHEVQTHEEILIN